MDGVEGSRQPMNESKPNGHSPDNVHLSHRPYGKRAQRDWRIWFFVILTLAAMAIYLMTGDLRWPLHAPAQPMVPATG
jgi:hypothetical protein